MDLTVMGREGFSLLWFPFYLIKILRIVNFQIGDFCKDNSRELGTKTVHLPPEQLWRLLQRCTTLCGENDHAMNAGERHRRINP